MKKLFLYISLLLSTFAITYFVTSSLYGHMKKKSNDDVILTDSLSDDYLPSENDSFYDYPAENVNSYIDNNNNITKDKYILGIKDGYVVVYFNDNDTVYEYTDIDAGILKLLDEEQYNKIKEHLTFDSIEELFDFLESLAS